MPNVGVRPGRWEWRWPPGRASGALVVAGEARHDVGGTGKVQVEEGRHGLRPLKSGKSWKFGIDRQRDRGLTVPALPLLSASPAMTSPGWFWLGG